MTEPIKGFKDEYRFLSNFWPVRIVYAGMVYRSVEHAYQASKCKDESDRLKVALAPSPGEAKRLGRMMKKRKDWDEVRVDIMYELNKRKYENPELRNMLLATGDAYLEETNNWYDRFWGVCKGEGRNQLGEILMNIRDKIKDEAPL